jgi:hypothetical protein
MMMQATLVALYGDKPDDLHAFLSDSQDRVADLLGSRFRKYDIAQIHGTIVGLERDEDEPQRLLNRNFRTRRDARIQMDLAGVVKFLRDGSYVPFQLQIGGFQDRDYPFVSRGARPYDRSFSIQERNVVVMGWPLRGLPVAGPPSSPAALNRESRLYPPTLDSIRRGAQAYGVLHSYHAKPEDTDNDYFFRIGIVDDPNSVDPLLKTRVQETMRELMAAMPPLVVEVGLPDLYVVFYDSEELPLSSTAAHALDNENLDQDFLRKGYT